MSHKNEIIDLIIAEYSQEKSRAHLEYEANTMEDLILPKLVPLGNINPGRFRRMADVMVKFGMSKEDYSIDDFIYDPEPKVNRETFVQTVILIVLLLLVSTVIALILWRLNKRLYIEIGKRHQVEKQLEYMAYNDRLTNIPNRSLLLDRLEQDMAQVGRRNLELAVAYLDLDGFKKINDDYGHAVGDQLLISVVDEMKKSLRDGDTLARVGGDEFVAVLADLKSIEESFPILDRLINSASLPMQINNIKMQVSVSIGVTYYPQDGEVNVEELLHQADQAMYKAKNSGKNCYQLYRQAEEVGLSV
jgi:diguanylate cyclase (GGDEF)-like protein